MREHWLCSKLYFNCASIYLHPTVKDVSSKFYHFGWKTCCSYRKSTLHQLSFLFQILQVCISSEPYWRSCSGLLPMLLKEEQTLYTTNTFPNIFAIKLSDLPVRFIQEFLESICQIDINSIKKTYFILKRLHNERNMVLGKQVFQENLVSKSHAASPDIINNVFQMNILLTVKHLKMYIPYFLVLFPLTRCCKQEILVSNTHAT